MTSELIAQLEYCKAENNIKGFDNALKVIRMKWDAISNKIPFGLPDGMWKYFFATVVSPLREKTCPREMQQRREENARRKAYWEQEKAYRRNQEEMFEKWREEETRAFYERLALAFLSSIDLCPLSSFVYFGLSEKASNTEDIMKAYREKALILHPDRGGKQEDFIELVEHKNKCLKWISRNQ